MDVLDDILDTLDLKGALYFRTDFSAPWSVEVPDHAGAARFHLVVQGRLHVEVAGGGTAELNPGDLILVPRGRSHILSDSAGRKPLSYESLMRESGYDGRGVIVYGKGDPEAATQMICGHFNFRTGADHPLLRALPGHIVVTAAKRAREPLLDDMLRMVARRLFAEGAGSGAAVTRLSEIVFIELLRVGIRDSGSFCSVLDAFSDRQIGRALELVHSRPGENWTVEKLASEVAMSRSRFAERFSELIGAGPMAYLADWRLQKALAKLETSRESVQKIAGDIGYKSPAAFTRAFAQKFGHTPLEYRKMAS